MSGRVMFCAALVALYYAAGVWLLPTWTTRLALEQLSDAPHASRRWIDLQTAWNLGWIVIIAVGLRSLRVQKGRDIQ